MPLLGNRLHVLNTVVKRSKKNCEETSTPEFVVPVTKEICSSADELTRKITIYESKIWTCRVTGRGNLTFKEALKSEHTALNLLKKSIPDHYRGVILQIVHKNPSPLEPLTQACWVKVHEKFVIGEPVLLKVDSNKPISATILSVDEAIEIPEVIDLSKDDTSSPNNSDKENALNSKRIISTKDTCSYSVQLVSDELVNVNNVPAKCIQRIHRPPPKDHIRMFIRAYAMRYGSASSGPWIVDSSALRKYCPSLKLSNNLIDKDKLRFVSEMYEKKFYEKIVSEKSKGNDVNNCENGIKLSPKSLKSFKGMTALRSDIPKAVVEPPNTPKIKDISEGTSKKMKQGILLFEKCSVSPTSGKKSKGSTPLTSGVILPSIARRLIRSIKSNVEASTLKVIVSRCVAILTDAQIKALPEVAQKLVIDKKTHIENRKKLQSMTPEQQKAYLRHLRLQRRALIDENAPFLQTRVQSLPLPEPRAFPLPPNMTSLQFSRVLSLTEFIACYQPLLTDSALSPGEMLYPTRVKQLASDLCRSLSDYDKEEEEFTSDIEEESALTSTYVALPKASVQGLRCLSLDRVLFAVSEQHMSAGSYRCLTRPMGALLRLLFLTEQFSKQTELGIKLSKIPITPYTAPELLRLLLQCELSNGLSSTNDRVVARIREVIASNGGNAGDFMPSQDALGAASLIEHLASTDLFDLDTEHRILAIEVPVELMHDFDTIDEYMHLCGKKAINAWQSQLALSRQKRTVMPPELIDLKPPIDKEPESDNLAATIKSRRVQAAKAAEEREIREVRERKRRELEAKIEAEGKALAKAKYDHAVASKESKLALRSSALGIDRQDRRYWYFFCAPDRLFVETNWGPEEYHIEDGLSKESPVVASCPPPHIFPDNLSNCQAVHCFGYGAYSRWFVLDQPDELDALANALVGMGARESQLKKSLVQSGLLDRMKEIITLSKADGHSELKEEVIVIDESPDKATIAKLTGKVRGDAQAILANVLLKNVYETEIHLRDGGLGGVPNFSGWIASILSIQEMYGLCFPLIGSNQPTPVKIVSAANNITPCTQSDACLSPSKTPLQSLAETLVAVGQHVNRRFLNVPKLRMNKLQTENISDTVNHENEDEEQRIETADTDKSSIRESDVELWMDAWVKAVRSAATLSRLNVLHACLDACILWEKSVVNIRCRICRRNKDDESLLLCDGCNSGFHLYCLRPPLHSIPPGDWFCVSCRPPKHSTTTTSGQRRDERREASEASDSRSMQSSASNSEKSSTSSEDEEEVEEVGQQSHPLRNRPSRRLSTKQPVSRSSSRSSLPPNVLAKPPASNLLSHDTICLVCDDEGTDDVELVRCSSCPNSFHPNCHNPPLRYANRRNLFTCSVCRSGGSISGGLSIIGSSLRPRASNRVNRKSSYIRLHRISSKPRKRPRSCSYAIDISDSESDDPSKSNDTETTEEQADERAAFPPPSKRPRTTALFTCADLISAVQKHRSSWPFKEPVDPKEVPDYYEIVLEPVDLSMIDEWLKGGRYKNTEGPQRLAEDLSKMFFNAELYNSVDSDIWKAGSQLENYVQSLFKKMTPPVYYKRDKLN